MKPFKSFLAEGISPVLYHMTDIQKLQSILDKDQFILSTDLGTSSDQKNNGSKFKPFFLSTSRIKYGGYTRSYGDAPYAPLVNIVLDGTKLSHNYSGKAVDYWGPEWRKPESDTHTRLRNDENEDRIFSPNDTIDSFHKYILEVHIMLGEKDIVYYKHDAESDKIDGRDLDRVYNNMHTMRKIQDLCQIYRIPVFFYNEFSAFKNLNKNKTWDGFKMNPYNNRIENYIELFEKDDINDLSEPAKKQLNDALYYNYMDAVSSLSAEIHNLTKGSDSTKKRSLGTFVKYMHKYKLRSIKEVIEFIRDKWKEDY